ncbi:coenzyme F420-0:L-glutamate ligase [Vibrio olivae]|uniref:Coenzyme F420-0:L-glutamate ligase n=1 Tax=Vibrio olivae TaxID=1243002 RepID=A0ABV5HK24_9VIBR
MSELAYLEESAFQTRSMTMFAVNNLPDFTPGMALGAEIINALTAQGESLQRGDILVIAHKAVSKCEGAMYDLDDVTPTDEAMTLAREVNKDPRKVEVILRQSSRILRHIKRPNQDEGIIIAEHKLGFICANAAVDESNADRPGRLITLPDDPDNSAQQLCTELEDYYHTELGLVISDTFGRPWRMGQTNVAIGVANVPTIKTLFGENDAWGRPLKVTAPAFADELAAASGLLMDKDAKCPVMIFRGLDWTRQHSHISQIIRPKQEDLFR